MRRQEEQFNTAEQVGGYIDEARRVIEQLALPDDLRVPAFMKAVDLIAGKQVFFEQPAAVQFDSSLLRPRH